MVFFVRFAVECSSGMAWNPYPESHGIVIRNGVECSSGMPWNHPPDWCGIYNCVKHDLKLIYGNENQYCPAAINDECTVKLAHHLSMQAKQVAKSFIEKMIKDKSFKPLP
jgi:hypothetical protein